MRFAQKDLQIPPCDLLYVWKDNVKSDLHLVLKKNWIWAPHFKKVMHQMDESGFFAKLHRDHFGHLLNSDSNCKPQVGAIGLDKLGSLLIFVSAGIIVSFAIFVIETLYQLRRKKEANRER